MEARAREYVLADSGARLPDQVREELTSAFTVEEDRHRARLSRTWLDTFDWRLYRAGLTLQHVSPPGPQGTRGTGELVLTGTGGQRLTAPGRLARGPSLPGALPPGPLRDRVAAVAGIRALLPTVSVTSQVREVRLRNADDKTVARIFVDAMSPRAPGGAPIPARLTLTEVRGYAAPARRAARLLAAGGATLSRQTALDAALSAAGRHPLDYDGRVDVMLRPAMPGAEAVRAILLQQLDNLEANVDGVLHDTDTEFLHDLRIAVRRTRSGLKLVGDVLHGELTLRFASEFRWLGDMTTPLRDLDVHLLSLPPMAKQLAAADPADLQPFLAYLERRRITERRKLSRVLRSARFAATVGDWRKALLVPPGNRPAPAGPSAGELAADRTMRAHGRVLKLGSAITGNSPPESLHTLRKRGKELRYVLEFFASLYDPPIYRAVLSDLKRLQDCLGDFQDNQVQREEIQSLAAGMLAQHAATAPTLLALGELAAQLATRQAQARAEFAERFAGFASREGRRRMTALITGESAGESA